ncbi:hypothetical protein ACQUWX_29235, partial [Ralstonia pseudosolanacearum]
MDTFFDSIFHERSTEPQCGQTRPSFQIIRSKTVLPDNPLEESPCGSFIGELFGELLTIQDYLLIW